MKFGSDCRGVMETFINIGAFQLDRHEKLVRSPEGTLDKLTDSHVRVLEALAEAKLSNSGTVVCTVSASAARVMTPSRSRMLTYPLPLPPAGSEETVSNRWTAKTV